MSLGHESLANYYKTNFEIIHRFNWSLTELESMIPWEREIYLSLLEQHIADENERMKSDTQ
jgi:hypothetical protein